MRKTLKWVATENNLFTLINKDVYIKSTRIIPPFRVEYELL